MTADGSKPTPGFWITVARVAVLAGYPLSFGPACWLTATPETSFLPAHPKAMIVYWPLGDAAMWNEPVGRSLRWWMRVGTPDGRIATVPTNPGGTHVVGFGRIVKMQWARQGGAPL